MKHILILLFLSATCFAQAEHGSPVASSNPSPASDTMVLIHGATTHMGVSPAEIPHFQKVFDIKSPELFRDELARHRVTLSDFYIDRYLVTNAEFKQFVDANPQWQPDRLSADLDNGNYLAHWKTAGALADKANHPVVNVNWYAAVAYCQWEGKRLPTEAEWEYAARGGISGLFSWGNEPADKTRANYLAAEVHDSSAVNEYPANGSGLFDMGGNVWQFLADEWQTYPKTAQKNPVGGGNLFATGTDFLNVKTRRVIRGGSFDGAPVNLWIEYRDSHPPNGSRPFVGFRCAK